MSLDTLTIATESVNDVDAIRDIALAAFEGDLEATLIDRLRASKAMSLSLVAKLEDHTPVGHLALSPAFVDGRAEPIGLALAPLAVMPARQRRGIGGALVRRSLEYARSERAPFIIVLGDPGYYSRFGFEPASRYGLEGEFGGGDAFMILVSDKKQLPPRGSLLRYHPVFREIFGGEGDGS